MSFKLFKVKRNSRGAAAMLVTTAMALLFVTLVVALSWLSLREQRQAGDTDLSNRAIANADASIKDAFALLKNNDKYRENTCHSDIDNGIACRTVTDEPGPVKIFAQKDQPRKANVYEANFDKNATIDSPGNTGVHYATGFEIFWCKIGSSNNNCSTSATFPSYFPTTSIFGSSQMPPVLELEFAYWQSYSADTSVSVNVPNTDKYGSIKPCAIVNTCAIDDAAFMQSKTFVLYPGTNQLDVSHRPDHGSFVVSCGGQIAIQTGYLCKSNKIRLAGAVYGSNEADAYKYRVIFSVTPRYGASYIEARFYNDKIASTSFPPGTKTQSDLVPVPSTSIIIDVTAKSGNIYRRLVSYLAKSTTARAAAFPSIYSGTDICKNMRVDDSFNVSDANGATSPCSENAPSVVY